MNEHTDSPMPEQPARRERIGGHAWVRTVGLVGSGLVAGGILAGTFTASAATDEETTTPPSVTQEDGMTTDDGTTTAPEDCPEDAAGMPGTPPGSSEEAPSTDGPSADPTA